MGISTRASVNSLRTGCHKFAVKKDKERKTLESRWHVAIVHAMLYRSNTVIDYLRAAWKSWSGSIMQVNGNQPCPTHFTTLTRPV